MPYFVDSNHFYVDSISFSSRYAIIMGQLLMDFQINQTDAARATLADQLKTERKTVEVTYYYYYY